MQNQQTTVPLGTVRTMPCRWCSGARRTPTRREHVYGELRSWRHVDRFWECIACGYQIIATSSDAISEPKLDPETERLHAQWREDNEG